MLIKNPKDPPNKHDNKSVFSLILYLCLIAFLLSIKQRIKEKMFISPKYINIF